MSNKTDLLIKWIHGEMSGFMMEEWLDRAEEALNDPATDPELKRALERWQELAEKAGFF